MCYFSIRSLSFYSIQNQIIEQLVAILAMPKVSNSSLLMRIARKLSVN
jgi:hypothetical protein